MTATATPPRHAGNGSDDAGALAGAGAETTARTPTRHRRSAQGPSLFVWSEIALACATLATVAGMWRLFADRSFLLPLVLQTAAAHTVAAVLRRRGVGLLPSAAITAGCAFLALCWGHLGHTTTYGVPTTETWDAAWDRLTAAWHGFDDVKAPAPVLPGFMLSLAAVLWVIGWAADTAAFRIWAPFEALIPSGTLFVFSAYFGTDENSLLAAAAWLAAALAFILIQRTARQQSSPSWLGSDPAHGTRALLRGGAFLGLIAVGATLIGSQALPGYGEGAFIDLDPPRNGRQTVSPLVEIHGRLIEQSDAELFSVTTSQRAYWRLTSLDIFDGNVWSSRGSFGRAEGELEGVPEPTEGSAQVTQSIEITGLSAIWVPAAFEPRAIEASDGADVRWEPESSTLIVSTDHPTSDGLIYDVTSDISSYSQEQLRAADGHIPRSVHARNIDLPPDFPQNVIAEARRVVEGAATPYDEAIALQNYFQSGNFTYSLSAPSGHSDTAIESFLFETRTGYCEQFAGTYAAMARAVGLPARVAVGFTPGDRDPLQPERYIVRGEHAHAWPEVFIAGVGWVAFEPTPGRGAPGAESYTGLREQQDTPGPSTDPVLTETPGTLPPNEGAGGTVGTDTTTTTLFDPSLFGGESSGAPVDEGIDGRDLLRYMGWFLLGAVGVAVLVVLVGCTVATTRALRRWLRHARAGTADAQVRAAWADAVESVEVIGMTPRRFETPLEYGRRMGTAIDDGRPTSLARIVEQADFAADGVTDDDAMTATELAQGVISSVHDQTTLRQRVQAAVDPRPPERRGRQHIPRPTGPRIQIRAEAR
jgi:transglutaminase-like putative cysteine protease